MKKMKNFFLSLHKNVLKFSFKKSFFSLSKKLFELKNKVNSKPLFKKIIYTLLLILTFRVAATITTPGIFVPEGFGSDPSSFIGILDLMGGGALRNFSIVALGISPYITASIIMTLLQSEVFPPLYRLSRSGPAGKRKINVITRFITLAFALVQAITIIQQLYSNSGVRLSNEFDNDLYKMFVLPIILVSGSMFTLFLGEEITNKGVGNGTSLIIFSGIVVLLPSKLQNAYSQILIGDGRQSLFVGIMNFALYISVFLFFIYLIGFLYKAERHVPIQQTGAGMTKAGTRVSHLPIKLNPAGVMPIIFALSLSLLPLTVVQFLHHQNEFRIWVETYLVLTNPLGLSILIFLTVIFTIAMSIVIFNPFQVADNFKKSNTFIPGIKPGEETENYLTKVILRLSVFSAFYLSCFSSMQYFQEIIGLNKEITFGGTSLIIMVTVAIETVSQLKARKKTIKISNAKRIAMDKSKGTEGLLW